MVPDLTKTSLGLEYFCTEERLWGMSDAELIELGKRELKRIGLAAPADIEDGCVFRVQKAYPIYDSEYRGLSSHRQKFRGRTWKTTRLSAAMGCTGTITRTTQWLRGC